MNDIINRFANMVDFTESCWNWTGCKNKDGYGRVSINGVNHYPHRWFYELSYGKVKDGLELDHKCHNTSCCNPDHLDEVTHLENMRRSFGNQNTKKTHCKNGHEFTKENTWNYNGRRHCKICKKENLRRWRNGTD